MLWPDVVELKSFYASPLGQVACQAIRRRLRLIWPQAAGETIIGVGFAAPYLLPFLGKSDICVACMPAAQGVIHWPQGRDNLTLLSDECELPFSTGTVNRVILIHALEHTEHIRAMLAEIYRLLTPSGRLLVIVPNRRGIWARSPNSIFAHGQPYSSGQIKRLLRESQFTPLTADHALFFPPTKQRFILRSARFIDVIGQMLFSSFGGVVIVEAEKQIYAPTKGSLRPVYSAKHGYGVATISS